MNLTEVGWTGKAHGLRGEIKLRVLELYEDEVLEVKSVLIGEPPVPYFVEQFRSGGAIIAKFEGLDSRELVSLLSNKPLYVLSSVIAEKEPEPDTPFDALVGWFIEAEGYPRLGPISEIMDLPEHYLAEMKHEGNDILVPLHEDLIIDIREDDQTLIMVLPDGLLTMGD
jgi:16S rRNA processing protein RimM